MSRRSRSLASTTGNGAFWELWEITRSPGAVVAGDLNGDGIDDIIIGAPESEGVLSKPSRSGWVYVIFSRNTCASTLELEKYFDVGFWGGKNAGNNLLGHSLAVADFNGDGISDLAIGVPQENGGRLERVHSGIAHIVFGRKTFKKVMDFPEEADVTLIGADPGDRLGFALASGGFNGDNIHDLALGAPGAAGEQNRLPGSGETYLIFGRARFPKGIDPGKNWNSRI